MSDKRSVSTDALETLGTIINEKAGRDAIHLAVEPAVAAERLYPGQDVGFVAGGVGRCDKPLGIVDPFLKQVVQQGERFWLVVYPRQITSLRHVWTHPAFENAAAPNGSKVESEAWLRRFCDKADGPGYEETIAAAINTNDSYGSYNAGEYLLIRGSDAHGEIPPEFWKHIEVVTGREIPSDQRATSFSCSC